MVSAHTDRRRLKPAPRRRFGGVLAVVLFAIGASFSTPIPHVAAAVTTRPQATTPSACRPTPVPSQLRSDRTSYEINLRVTPANGRVTGLVRATFRPDAPIDTIEWRAWPNGRVAAGKTQPVLRYGEMTIDGVVSVPRPVPGDPTRVVLALPASSSPGAALTLTATFTILLPRQGPDRMTRTPNGLRLGSFVPLLDWVPGRGWSNTPATTAPGEAMGFAAADFALRVEAPEGFDVLATGTRGEDGVWRATGVRDIAVAVGRFRSESREVALPDGRRITARVAVDAGMDERPSLYLDRIVRALGYFSEQYGSYPWPSYTVVVAPGMRGGIEYPMLTHQGPGSSGRSTPHEVAHQWFYSWVGNDQGVEPWLDEGLASWAEARFEGSLESFSSRSIPAAARGRMTAPMKYWDAHPGEYYRGVYVATVQTLLVAADGRPELIDCGLRDYVARHGYAIASRQDLVASMEPYVPLGDGLG